MSEPSPAPLPEAPDKITRKWIGTRVGFALVSVLCYFGTIVVITNFGTKLPDPELLDVITPEVFAALDPVVVLDQEKAWTALDYLLGVLAIAIIGDTARPSGMKGAAFGVTSVKA